MKRENLYFVAIVPPDGISGQITAYKQELMAKYQSKQALRSPPHLTLHMPFRWKEEKYSRLESVLAGVARLTRPFEVSLEGFGGFEPRVIYISVHNTGPLRACQAHVREGLRSLHILNADYKEKPFHPHVTIAFRDLKKTQYYRAMDELRERTFSTRFVARSMVLLRQFQEAGQKPEWRVYQTFDFLG